MDKNSETMKYDIVTFLNRLKVTADGCSSDFASGYQMAIQHAIELAEVIQRRNQGNK